MLGRLAGVIVVELLAGFAAFWVSGLLNIQPPLSLVLLYALFRANEYYALKHFQELMRYPPPNSDVPRLAISILLFFARVAGWGMLIMFAFKSGIGVTAALLVVAFIVSLAFQSIYEFTIKPLSTLGFLITLAIITVSATVILFKVVSL